MIRWPEANSTPSGIQRYLARRGCGPRATPTDCSPATHWSGRSTQRVAACPESLLLSPTNVRDLKATRSIGPDPAYARCDPARWLSNWTPNRRASDLRRSAGRKGRARRPSGRAEAVAGGLTAHRDVVTALRLAREAGSDLTAFVAIPVEKTLAAAIARDRGRQPARVLVLAATTASSSASSRTGPSGGRFSPLPLGLYGLLVGS